MLLVFGMFLGFTTSYGVQRDKFRNQAIEAGAATYVELSNGDTKFQFVTNKETNKENDEKSMDN